MKIKIFGLMRSGTNVLEMVLRDNFAVEILPHETTGSKHHKPNPKKLAREKPDSILVCVKNPYAWLHSAYRRLVRIHVLKQGNFKSWLSGTLDDKTYTEDYDRGPIQAWNQLNRAWLNCKHARVRVIHSERMVTRELAIPTFRELAQQLGVKNKLGKWKIPSFYVRGGQKATERPWRPKFYTKARFMGRYTAGLLKEVNRRLDYDLMRRLEYEPAGE